MSEANNGLPADIIPLSVPVQSVSVSDQWVSMKATYEAKGYSKEWITKRSQSIEVRKKLTDIWKAQGVEEGAEYAILTAEISKATFGMTPREYSQHKGLKHANLRDHMTDLELIFTMLGEASTTEITRQRDTFGFSENLKAARDGGKVAGDARENLEKRTGQSIISSENHLPVAQSKKLKTPSRLPVSE